MQILMSTVLLTVAFTQGDDTDPVQWRDTRDASLRSAWDELEGTTAPALDGLGQWLNTRPLGWEELSGHVVLVQAFSSEHKRCLRTLEGLAQVFQERRDQGFTVLLVHAAEGAEELAQVVENGGVPFAVAVDASGEFLAALSAQRLPAYFLVGRDGRLRIAGVRLLPGDVKGGLDPILERVLAEPWHGTRGEIEYVARRSRAAPPALRLAPGGWPAHEEKLLHARRDQRGKPAPPLEVEGWLTAEPRIAGRPYLLVLWTTWAGKYVATLRHLERLHLRFGDRLAVVALSDQAPRRLARSSNRPWGDALEQFVAKHPEYTFAFAVDGQARVQRALRAKGLPNAILVDSEGIVRWQGIPLDEDHPLTPAIVEQVLAVDETRSGAPRLSVAEEALRLEGAPSSRLGALRIAEELGTPFRASLAVPGEWTLGAPFSTDGRGAATRPGFRAPDGQTRGLAVAVEWWGRLPLGYEGPEVKAFALLELP